MFLLSGHKGDDGFFIVFTVPSFILLIYPHSYIGVLFLSGGISTATAVPTLPGLSLLTMFQRPPLSKLYHHCLVSRNRSNPFTLDTIAK